MAGGLLAGRALLQEENVGRDFRAGIGLERRVGKADRAEQVGAVGQIARIVASCLSIV